MILLSAGGDSIQRSATPSDTLLVGTTTGIEIHKLGDDGDWPLAHKALTGCIVSAVTRLSDGRLIAGMHGGGIARSEDNGESWTLINRGIRQFDIWTVRAHVLNGKELIFAGSMPSELYVSRDGGDNWRVLEGLTAVASAKYWFFPPPPHLAHVKEIAVHQNKELYVGIEIGGLFRSDDEGETFVELPMEKDISDADVHRILLHPDRPGRIVVANGIAGTTISEDHGKTWTRVTNTAGVNYPDPMVMHPDNPDLLFVAGARGYPPNWYKLGRARPRIARSTDGGYTWHRLLGGLCDGQRAVFGGMTMEVWPGGYALFAADTDGQIFESRDGGDSWHMITETGPVSKGDFYMSMSRNRPPMMRTDDVIFGEGGTKRVKETKA